MILELHENEHQSFYSYLWRFVEGIPIQNGRGHEFCRGGSTWTGDFWSLTWASGADRHRKTPLQKINSPTFNHFATLQVPKNTIVFITEKTTNEEK